MDIQGIITYIMEIMGTIAFAASGAMVGIRKRMDIFGVCVLGFVTACGGGMVRDVILGITPPNVFRNPDYALVAVVTSILVFAVIYVKRDVMDGSFKVVYDKTMLIMDTIGLAIFTVVGVNIGIQQGYLDKIFLLTFAGTITGVGGGLMRDMMADQPPYIFVKHIYASASVVGSLVCVYMYRAFGAVVSMVVSSAVILLIRYLAAHYHWNLPHVEFKEER
ncbi:MAG: trimeric intracellular cation channel family protein [Lachnospiraceae bacterium]|nr:trimeric intracellular cation channel family protein [Lachnospiraceae bacterium]